MAYWGHLHKITWKSEANEHLARSSIWHIVEILLIHYSVFAAWISTSLWKTKVFCDSFDRNPGLYVNLFMVIIPLSVSIYIFLCWNINMFVYSLLPEALYFSKIRESLYSKTDMGFYKEFWLVLTLYIILMGKGQEGTGSKKWSEVPGPKRDIRETDQEKKEKSLLNVQNLF